MEQAPKSSVSPQDRKRTARVSACNRSALSNGSRLGYGIDLRTREGRRYRDLYRHYLAETDGRHETLVKQLASLIVARERMDAKLASGQDVNVFDLVRLSGAINRTMTRIGLLAEGEDEPTDATDIVLQNLRAAAS